MTRTQQVHTWIGPPILAQTEASGGGMGSTGILPMFSDADLSTAGLRTVTDLVTVNASNEVKSKLALWTEADINKVVDAAGLPFASAPPIVTGIVGHRTIADAILNGTTTLQTASPQFTADDEGATLDDLSTVPHIPDGATIATYVSSTQVTMSAAATGSASGVSVEIGATRATLSVNATASASGVTATIGNSYGAKILSWGIIEASGTPAAGTLLRLGSQSAGGSTEYVNDVDLSTLTYRNGCSRPQAIVSPASPWHRAGYNLLIRVIGPSSPSFGGVSFRPYVRYWTY